ncbi:MAG: DUF3617 domain-containing protein [Terricaulis sp.]
MVRRGVFVIAAVALACCSPPAATTNGQQSASPASAPVTASGTGIQPGQYRTVVTVVSASIPGVPPAQVQAMQAQPITDESCVTSSDINELARKSLVDADEGENCSDNHLSATGGHIEGASTCTNADGDSTTMQVTGSYTATHVEMDATMTGQTAAGQMSQHVHMVTDRIGACAAH